VAIDFVNRQRLVKIDRRRLERVAQMTLAALGEMEKGRRANAGLTIVLVRDRKIQELNRKYRGKDWATDVLSFPTGDPRGVAPFFETDDLGDIVISTDTALRQARDAKSSIEREVEELVIHGVLHLCGYDHETDDGEMNRLELKMRRKLLDSSLVRRG
jgi:probable rRNA maturation factor